MTPNHSLTAGEEKPVTELDRLRAVDAEITAALKGPMSNLERAWLVADRRDVRAAIAKAEASQ